MYYRRPFISCLTRYVGHGIFTNYIAEYGRLTSGGLVQLAPLVYISRLQSPITTPRGAYGLVSYSGMICLGTSVNPLVRCVKVDNALQFLKML
jgi:hypothetical protein